MGQSQFHTAATGDSVYYAGGLRHRWRSLGDEEVRLVVVQQNRPPTARLTADAHWEAPNLRSGNTRLTRP